MRRLVSVFLLTLLLSSLAFTLMTQPASPQPTTITIPDEYLTIQEAINAASSGDTVFVRNGTYFENIVVNKSISLSGEDKYNTVIDGNRSGTVITVIVNNVTITDFTVKGGGAVTGSGIVLNNCEKTLVANNLIKENSGNAIFLQGSRENIIKENDVIDNMFGIYAWLHSSHNHITENLIANKKANIYLVWSSYNNITRNVLSNSETSIHVFYHCLRNEIRENSILNNTLGVMFSDGCNQNRIFHNNFINNTKQATVFSPEEDIPTGIEPSSNIWDNNYPNGGNYWSNNVQIDVFNGPDQDVPGCDAISDSPFLIAENNRDNYPLMYPWRIIRIPSEYSTIQEGLNVASPGDTIHVSAGIYYEHLIVKKSVALVGENKHTTIVDGNATGTYVARVYADNVTISGFTFQRGGTYFLGDQGTILLRSDNNVVNENVFRDSFDAIAIEAGHRNVFSSNIVTNMSGYGMRLYRCTGNRILENNITCTELPGIFGSRSANNNEIRGNFLANISEGGIYFASCSGNYIAGNKVTNCGFGVGFEVSSHDNIVIDNTLWSNSYGLKLGPIFSAYTAETPYNNVFAKNEIICNEIGVQTVLTDGNQINQNNFVNNTKQFHNYLSIIALDNGVEGNYWSDYGGIDANHDGIGDTPHVLDANNTDHYPLMGMFHSFDTSVGYYVNIISNSTIYSFQYESPGTIRFHVSNMTANQTHGFCRVSIPYEVMNEPFNVTINGAEPIYYNYTLYDNGSHRWIYFEYEHSIKDIIIIPEVPAFAILPLLMISTLLTALLLKEKSQV